MPGQIRPNARAMKIAYKILKTTKSKRQKNETHVSKERLEGWLKDSSLAQ